jgi:hypothetical protein
MFPAHKLSVEAKTLYDEASVNLDKAADVVRTMQQSFTDGGSISFSDLGSYTISTENAPMPFPTGRNCVAYRIPDTPSGQIRFYCIFEPMPNDPAQYGWHNHPDCEEEVIQLTGTAEAFNKKIPPFSKSIFRVGQYHDYIMREPGTILVTFTEK